jgi:hypothetical protein
MFKKRQKWIAPLVILAFVWLLRVSAVPLAAGTTEQAISASAEPEPGFFEQEGPEWSRSGKRNATLILFVGILAVSFLMLIIRGIDFDAAPDAAAGPSGAGLDRGLKFGKK